MGQLVNSEEPSHQVIKSSGGSKTKNEIFITKNNVWGPKQDHSMERQELSKSNAQSRSRISAK